MNQQPKVLYLLCAVKMWECFSYYGMRALLVLYLINQLGLSDLYAYGIYAIYGALFEFGGVLGGRVADRLLGLKQAIMWGGWLIAVGHICLSLQTTSWAFFSGLGLIVVGSALFSTNISALLGLFYQEDDPRRESGYTLFYIGINIGALLASIFCGVIGELYGWHYGFGLAAIGMIAGNILFLYFQQLLEGKGELQRDNPSLSEKFMGYGLLALSVPICVAMVVWEEVFMPIMPCLNLFCLLYVGRKMLYSGKFSKQSLALLGLYLAALSLLYAAEDLSASALLVFSERFATGTIGGVTVPVTALLSLNPFIIILGGFFMSRWKMGNTHQMVIIGLLLCAGVFAALAIACYFPNHEGLVPSLMVAITVIVISLGEVLLAPAVLAYCSQISPKEWSGATMGLIPVGVSLGNITAGFLSKSMAVSSGSLEAYQLGFAHISLLLGAMTVITVLGPQLIRKELFE